MPTYTFNLHNRSGGVEDATGVNLPNRKQALAYAQNVVGEIMQGREVDTRSWQLDVYENQTEKVFEIPFASVDYTLDHLAPQLRTMVESLCERQGAFSDVVFEVGETIREARALVARSRGKLYVAAERGKAVIRGR